MNVSNNTNIRQVVGLEEVDNLLKTEELVDATSYEDLLQLKALGIPMHQIYYRSKDKSLQEINNILGQGVQNIVVDHLLELNYILSLNMPLNVYIRVNPGIEGGESNLDGINFESNDLRQVFSQLFNSNVNLVGLHCHVNHSLNVMLDQIKLLEHQYHLNLSTINFSNLSRERYNKITDDSRTFNLCADILDHRSIA